jgi:transcriptional regulator with XRE-family HTH domain
MIDCSKSIAELLKESGISQAEMCRRTGISPPTMSRLMTGNNPSVLMYAKIYNEYEKEIHANGKKTKGN